MTPPQPAQHNSRNTPAPAVNQTHKGVPFFFLGFFFFFFLAGRSSSGSSSITSSSSEVSSRSSGSSCFGAGFGLTPAGFDLGAGASSSVSGTTKTFIHFGHLIREPAARATFGLSVALQEGQVMISADIAARFRRLWDQEVRRTRPALLRLLYREDQRGNHLARAIGAGRILYNGVRRYSPTSRWAALTPGGVFVIRIEKILYPTDFSSYSNQAYFHAIAQAESHGAALTILFVYTPDMITPGSEGDEDADHRYWQNQLEQIRPTDAAISVRHVFLVGDPAAEIVRYGRDAGMDLIVMGTHGRTGVE